MLFVLILLLLALVLLGMEKSYWSKLGRTKETTLERADFTLQLLMFTVVNRGKGEKNVYNFLSLQFLSAAVPAVLS